MKTKKWYKIQSKADDTAEISIFGDIGFSWWSEGVTAKDFKKDFDEIKNASAINVIINSPGGDVFDGIAIYNIIASQREKVSVEVIGLAASAASVIALAGSTLTMDEGAMLMIHNVWSWSMGNADDFRKMADDLDKISDQLLNIYEAHSDLSAEEIKAFMDKETWFDADEAIEYGFAQSKSEHEDMAASVSFDFAKYGYKHVPEQFKNAEKQLPETARELEALLRDAGFSRKRAIEITSHGFDAEVQRDAGTSEGDQRDTDSPQVDTEENAIDIPYHERIALLDKLHDE